MNNKIIDGMKKEGKLPRIFTIISVILIMGEIIFMLIEKQTIKDTLIIILYLSFCCLIFFYGWLYSAKYKVEIDESKIRLKTLFNKIELNMSDIKNFSCKRYLKSSFYQFSLYTKNKKVLVNTRYRDEFIQILRENNIKQISWKNK